MFKRVSLSILQGLAVLTAGAAAQVADLEPALVPDTVRAEIVGFLTSYYDALSDRDWGRFSAHFWPGATITTVWQAPGETTPRVTSYTVPAFIEQAPAGPGSKEIFEERMLSAEVHMRSGLGMVFARYRARFGNPGDVSEWEGLDSFALLKHAGEWRIVSLSFAPES
jgi:hypothetical protein